eukprot:4371182-Prymnesium_polylepis.2
MDVEPAERLATPHWPHAASLPASLATVAPPHAARLSPPHCAPPSGAPVATMLLRRASASWCT